MRALALSLVVLLCVSVSQAGVGYTKVYDFDSLSPGLTEPTTPLCSVEGGTLITGQQTDSEVAWLTAYHPTAGTRVNAGADHVNGDGAGDLWAERVTGSNERLCSSLVDPNNGTLFLANASGTLESTDTFVKVSYTMYNAPVSYTWINGIWLDANSDNDMANNEDEMVVQFGVWPNSDPNRSDRHWRVRGFAGTTNGYSGGWVYGGYPESLDSTSPYIMRCNLFVDLTNLVAHLYVENLSTGENAWVVTSVPLASGLSQAVIDLYKDPTNWTGFAIRDQGSASNQWVDDLTLEVIPEPATLSLLVLGGLACIRRRR